MEKREEEASVTTKLERGTAAANLDFEEERRDGKGERAELINVLGAILSFSRVVCENLVKGM